MSLSAALEEAAFGVPWDNDRAGVNAYRIDEGVSMLKRGYADKRNQKPGYLDFGEIEIEGRPPRKLVEQVLNDIFAKLYFNGVAYIRDPDNKLKLFGFDERKLAQKLKEMWDKEVYDDVENEIHRRGEEIDPERADAALGTAHAQQYSVRRVQGKTGAGWRIKARVLAKDVYNALKPGSFLGRW